VTYQLVVNCEKKTREKMSGSIETARRPLTPSHLEGVCPCCRRKQERPRLLGCLHTVCTPCLNQVLMLLVSLTNSQSVSQSGGSQRASGTYCYCNSKQEYSFKNVNMLKLNCLPFTSEQKRGFLEWPSP